ncbi:ribosome recycling factor family protein [Vibrio sp. S4M6]|uniref:ribosome recycling factor family protein n=1 Tax=Vibrio sinus TaxID=2946865 RepID=UPI00202A4853|nr:ribosome recycling factor family protein [Vibrio sinus]MCL9782435.1 ribosome recycling factor family protein [Vibrio sinus]
MCLITIPLPSLIHRLGGPQVKQAKLMAQQHQCELKRIRRSRNWSLTGHADNLLMFADALRKDDEQAFAHLLNKIENHDAIATFQNDHIQSKLERLISQNPAITLAELMEQTQCSLAEARSARFRLDSL